MRKTSGGFVAAAVAGSALAAATAVAPTAGASTAAPRASHAACNWATVTSAAACGGMKALVAAAQKEGVLNTITLPANWANYGTLIKEFSNKYHIKVNDAIPDGSSQQELNAIIHEKGTSKAPDVLDVGPAFALEGASQGLFSPYKVLEYNQIPANEKAANAAWYYDYGGYISIGYNASDLKVAPTSFKSLTNPAYKGSIALNGNPTQAGAAFAAVYAASLANGGSFSNITPGVTYFKKLAQDGNFITAQSDATTIGSGQVKVSIDWDYLNAAYAAQLKAKGIDWKVVIPTDAHYAAYYVQAISKYAPDPAAARLWEEFLYSNEGQNGWLGGFARPVLLDHMVKLGTVDRAELAKIPVVSGTPSFPSQSQQKDAAAVLLKLWPSV
ncbi:MAG TPA: ABC transporter substrate-binding protein [Acidimicrobiales bacterium]|nr:ABC transporter substrate-binding protein [Acidimicrobiales bacterium]